MPGIPGEPQPAARAERGSVCVGRRRGHCVQITDTMRQRSILTAPVAGRDCSPGCRRGPVGGRSQLGAARVCGRAGMVSGAHSCASHIVAIWQNRYKKFVARSSRVPGHAAVPRCFRTSSGDIPGHSAGAAPFLGRARMCHPAALRHGGGRRDVPSRNGTPFARAAAWSAAYVQASRRPTDGRYGGESEPPPALLPVPGDSQAVPEAFQRDYLESLEAIGIDLSCHDIRFVEDDGRVPPSAHGVSAGRSGATEWR